MLNRLAMITVTLATTSVLGGVTPLDPNQNTSAQLNGPMKPTTHPTPAAVVAALVSDVDAKFTAVEREIARLRAMGEPAQVRADALAARLELLRARREGRGVIQDNQPELHYVGVYEGAPPAGAAALTPAQRRRQPPGPGTAVVEVQATGRPIILALGACESVKWEVRLAKDANVQRILLGGYYDQSVSGAPNAVPIEKYTYDGKSPNYFQAYDKKDDSYRECTARLKTLTGMEPSTFQGIYRYAGQPLVIGPGSEEWLAQRLLTDLEPLYRESIAYDRAVQRDAVRKLRFKAVRFSATVPGRVVGGGAGGNVVVRIGGGTTATLADFSPLGPIDGTDQPLPPRTAAAVIDPVDSTAYALDMHTLSRVDAQTKQVTALNMDDPTLPRVSWPSGVAFDTKRRRLVLASFGGSGYLYAYDPVAGKWSGMVDLENVDISGLAYLASADCFYAAAQGRGPSGVVRLIRYTSAGDPDQLIETSRPLRGGTFRPDSTPQLIAVGNLLAYLPPPPMDMTAMRARAQGVAQPEVRMCYLIDPATGDITYGGRMEPQPATAPNLAEAELDEAWRGLTVEDPAQVEQAATKLVSGEEKAVTFLRRELAKQAAPEPVQVKGWIAKLDHEDFAQRDAATRELRRLGRSIEPALREARAGATSAEAGARLDALLQALQPGADGNNKTDRDSITFDVLARIGSPTAIELLGDLAAGAADAPRTLAARRALQEFAKDG